MGADSLRDPARKRRYSAQLVYADQLSATPVTVSVQRSELSGLCGMSCFT